MPDFSPELLTSSQWGVKSIAGLDEAGRGALAGPVVAAAVIFPFADDRLAAELAGVDDSKRLSARRRERILDEITGRAVAYATGSAGPTHIDQHGIIAATKAAMYEALTALAAQPEGLLIDGRLQLAQSPLPQRSVVRGDSLSLSIAAASIVAKVTRDRLLLDYDRQYPAYGFARHKGYGTPEHLAALDQHGSCPLHRLSFSPMRRSWFAA